MTASSSVGMASGLPSESRMTWEEPIRELKIYEVDSRKELRVIRQSGWNFEDVRFSPDGSTIAATTHSDLYVWVVESGERIPFWFANAGQISYSGDGRTLAGIGSTGRLGIFDLATRRMVFLFNTDVTNLRHSRVLSGRPCPRRQLWIACPPLLGDQGPPRSVRDARCSCGFREQHPLHAGRKNADHGQRRRDDPTLGSRHWPAEAIAEALERREDDGPLQGRPVAYRTHERIRSSIYMGPAR